MATIVHDDGQLVRAARKGDQAAFAELVHQHRRRIWSVCYRITENSYDAEDAVQDCLIAAWHHLDAFRGQSSFGTWIYRIAANSALAITRRRRPEVSDDQLPEAAHDDFSQRVVDVDTVGRALRQLPLSFRSVLVLRELCDLSYEQIAEHEGIGVQTVKSRLNRARTMLRTALVAAVAPPD